MLLEFLSLPPLSSPVIRPSASPAVELLTAGPVVLLLLLLLRPLLLLARRVHCRYPAALIHNSFCILWCHPSLSCDLQPNEERVALSLFIQTTANGIYWIALQNHS